MADNVCCHFPRHGPDWSLGYPKVYHKLVTTLSATDTQTEDLHFIPSHRFRPGAVPDWFNQHALFRNSVNLIFYVQRFRSKLQIKNASQVNFFDSNQTEVLAVLAYSNLFGAITVSGGGGEHALKAVLELWNVEGKTIMRLNKIILLLNISCKIPDCAKPGLIE